MSKNKSYEELFMERLQKESEELQKEVEKHCKDTKYIFANAQEIYLKAMFIGRFTNSEESEETYKRWLKKDGNILQGLYERYRDHSHVIEGEDFYSDQVIEDYFKAGEIEDTDYKKRAIERIEGQFENFKMKLLAECETKEDMFYKAFEINIKTALRDAARAEELSEGVYYAIAETKENTLHEMYTDFIGERASVNTQREAADFIESYYERYYSDLIEEYEQGQSEGMTQG